MDSPMKKMILILKLVKRNSALALSTVFDRLLWPSLLPQESGTRQIQRGFTQHIS
jgi:hypothetical protein